MSEISGILGANLELRNEKGEIIFAMKRKTKYPPIYYIFEKHEDRMNDEEKEGFEKAWAMIKVASAMMGYRLHDMREITDAMEAQLKAVMETDEFKKASKKVDDGGDEKAFIKDIHFKVFDHATGTLGTLTIGISTMSAEGVKNITDNEQRDTQETK